MKITTCQRANNRYLIIETGKISYERPDSVKLNSSDFVPFFVVELSNGKTQIWYDISDLKSEKKYAFSDSAIRNDIRKKNEAAVKRVNLSPEELLISLDTVFLDKDNNVKLIYIPKAAPADTKEDRKKEDRKKSISMKDVLDYFNFLAEKVVYYSAYRHTIEIELDDDTETDEDYYDGAEVFNIIADDRLIGTLVDSDYIKNVLNIMAFTITGRYLNELPNLILTPEGHRKVRKYISEMTAKRKKILDAGKDTGNETDIPDDLDILLDVGWTGDGENYEATWPVTDHICADTPIILKEDTDYALLPFMEKQGVDPDEVYWRMRSE